MKKGFKGNLESLTKENSNFRKVLYTGPHSQLVLMSLKPGEDIGMEVHDGNDQFFRFDQGEGEAIVGETKYVVKDGDGVVVPAGTEHNVINTSSAGDLRFYTIYSPAHHQDGVVRATKEEANDNGPEFDGKTTE
jgi:mannose-6-phosphate isomerase-like protein (cupin superfamily)